jgi:hypothetical protein
MPTVPMAYSGATLPDFSTNLTALTVTGDAICNRILRIQRLKTAAPNHH